MFLTKLYHDLLSSHAVYLYTTPILDDNEFFTILAQDILDVKYKGDLNFIENFKGFHVNTFIAIGDERCVSEYLFMREATK